MSSLPSLDEERKAIIAETMQATRAARDVVQQERKILWYWNTGIKVVGGVLIMLIIRIVSDISFTRHTHAHFIAMVDKYRNMVNSNGQPFYTGKSGLITAMAMQNPLVNYTFNNRFLPFALYYSVTSPKLAALYNEPEAPAYMQAMMDLSLEGKVSGKTLNALDIACEAAKSVFGTKAFTACPKSACNIGTSNMTGSFGQNMAQNAISQGTNMGMAGHMISSAMAKGEAGEAGGGAGLLIGLAVGASIGIAQSYIQRKSRSDICSYAEQFCTPEASQC